MSLFYGCNRSLACPWSPTVLRIGALYLRKKRVGALDVVITSGDLSVVVLTELKRLDGDFLAHILEKGRMD